MKLPDYVKDYTHLFNWTDFWGEPIPEEYKYAAVDWNGLLYAFEDCPEFDEDRLIFTVDNSDYEYLGVVAYSGRARDTLKMRENYSCGNS